MRSVLAYDISDDRCRYRVAILLEQHGVKIQRSVYDLVVDDREVDGLMATLTGLIDFNRDVVHLLPECATCFERRQAYGQVHNPLDDAVWIV